MASFTSSHTALLLKNYLGLLVFCSFLFSLGLWKVVEKLRTGYGCPGWPPLWTQ